MSEAALKTPLTTEFQEFRTYWDSLPKADGLPNVSDYLDHVPAHLQPNVVIIDLHDPETVFVRLAGTAVVNFVGEITGATVEDLYAEAGREMAKRMAWLVAAHPCGYIVDRTFHSQSQMVFRGYAMGLPLRRSDPTTRSLVIYNEFPVYERHRSPNEVIEAVHEFGSIEFIDIGMGTPGA